MRNWYWLMLLVCPLMHILMMGWHKRGGQAGAGCHGHTADKERANQS